MSNGEYSAERFLPRIRKELERLPLTDEQKSDGASKIVNLMQFLAAGGKGGGTLDDTSEFFDFELKTRTVVERFAGDGLTAKDYLQAALKQPSLFTQKPTTIIGNIEGVFERFTSDGLIRRDYLRAAIKQPQLFAQAPETVIGNIAGVAERFAGDGLTTKDYLQAALKQPSLFCQAPETVVTNIVGVAERFASEGLTRKDYLRAALKQPSLFTQTPETIARHVGLVLDLYDDGVFTLPRPRDRSDCLGDLHHPHAPVLDFLLRNPVLLCLEDNNLYLRGLYKEMTDAAPSPKNLLRSRREIEGEMMRQLGHDDPTSPVQGGGYITGRGPPTEEQAKRFVLRALAREGYIKSAKLER